MVLLFVVHNMNTFFHHCLLTIKWNFTVGFKNIIQSSVKNIEWKDDALICFLVGVKGNQEGKNKKNPWHIYFNTSRLHICPLPTLAK